MVEMGMINAHITVDNLLRYQHICPLCIKICDTVHIKLWLCSAVGTEKRILSGDTRKGQNCPQSITLTLESEKVDKQNDSEQKKGPTNTQCYSYQKRYQYPDGPPPCTSVPEQCGISARCNRSKAPKVYQLGWASCRYSLNTRTQIEKLLR